MDADVLEILFTVGLQPQFKFYLRYLYNVRDDSVLDPILHDLLSSDILRVPRTLSYNGRQIRCFSYPRAFDQNYVHYLLETLLAVTKFGGQGFTRIARVTPMRRTNHPNLISAAEKGNPSIACYVLTVTSDT